MDFTIVKLQETIKYSSITPCVIDLLGRGCRYKGQKVINDLPTCSEAF
jgi:hypothetical protein